MPIGHDGAIKSNDTPIRVRNYCWVSWIISQEPSYHLTVVWCVTNYLNAKLVLLIWNYSVLIWQTTIPGHHPGLCPPSQSAVWPPSSRVDSSESNSLSLSLTSCSRFMRKRPEFWTWISPEQSVNINQFVLILICHHLNLMSCTLINSSNTLSISYDSINGTQSSNDNVIWFVHKQVRHVEAPWSRRNHRDQRSKKAQRPKVHSGSTPMCSSHPARSFFTSIQKAIFHRQQVHLHIIIR